MCKDFFFLLFIYSVNFEGGNQKICTFKLSFSTVFHLLQALCWFCYNTVIAKKESLLRTSLSCIYIVFAIT